MPPGRHLFVSDLHLDCAAPAATALFLDFIEREARQAAALYILGDLFESWIGDDDDDAARTAVCAALRALTDSGVPCHVQHGNRDFLLGEGFAARTGCRLMADPATLEVGGTRFALSHGDALCTRDVAYQRFRRIVRNRALQRGWSALPLALRRRMAGGIRQRSRAHTSAQAPQVMDVTPAAVAQLLRETGADVLIHGHTHRPGVHRVRVDGALRTRIVLGDWYEQGSVLTVEADGTYALRTLSHVDPLLTPGVAS